MRSVACGAILAALTLAAPARAQVGPGFDCAKASTVVERAICKSPELASADRDMAGIYTALAARLGGAARNHLVEDQARWIGNRALACGDGPLETSQCLKIRFADRIAFLRALDTPGAYPFVSERDLVKNGRVKTTRYRIDASYPQFDGGTADFTATNRRFASEAKNGADDAIPPADIDSNLDQTWNNLVKLMSDPDRWLFKAAVVQIVFNPYDVGPYASGAYTVDIPYDRIRSFFRADGPIGR